MEYRLCCFTTRLLADLKLGRAPAEMQYPVDFSSSSEESLYIDFLEKGVPPSLSDFSTAGKDNTDMMLTSPSCSAAPCWNNKI